MAAQSHPLCSAYRSSKGRNPRLKEQRADRSHLWLEVWQGYLTGIPQMWADIIHFWISLGSLLGQSQSEGREHEGSAERNLLRMKDKERMEELNWTYPEPHDFSRLSSNCLKQMIFIPFTNYFCWENLKIEMGGKCPLPNKQCGPVMKTVIPDSKS